MYSKDLQKRTVQALAYKLLVEHGRLYGYEFQKRLKEKSKDLIRITEGSFYPVLHEMRNANLLIIDEEKVDGRIRRYYSLTPEGKHAAAAAIGEIAELLDTIQKVLRDQL